MRTRNALMGLALVGALAVGGTAMPAQAADGAAARQVAAGETRDATAHWHFYRAYWTKAACLTEGDALGYPYTCSYGKGNDGRYKWFLYLWY